MKNLKTGLTYYKCLQLQNNLFNEVFANNFNQGYIFLLIICFTTASYCAVRLHNTLDFFIYILFPIMPVFLGVIITIIGGITGKVHDRSWAMLNVDYNMLLNLSYQNQTERYKKMRHIMMLRLLSSPSLKVWIGNLYFMKIRTKLTLLAHLINSTVYFLLST